MMHLISIDDARGGIIAHDFGALDVRGALSQLSLGNSFDRQHGGQRTDYAGDLGGATLGIIGVVGKARLDDARIRRADADG